MRMTDREAGISVTVLGQLIEANFDTGNLKWKVRPLRFFSDTKQTTAHNCAIWNGKFAGRPAFAHSSGSGYFHGSLFNQKFYAHRIIYAMFHGAWPVYTIDHINGCRTDNRPSNLRDVEHQENMRNMSLSKASRTGITGISKRAANGKFMVKLTVDGKGVSGGDFSSIEDAIEAKEKLANKIGFHKNHGRNKHATR